MANTETAAQPIDLDKRRCNCGKTVDVCVVTPCHNFHDTGIDTELENYAALARQKHEPSGNAGEVAADCQAAFKAWHDQNGDQDCEYTWAEAWQAAQRAAAPAAPHAQAEPVGYISEGTRAMLAAGCSTPITISISTGKVGAWCAPIYLAAPVPHAQAEPVGVACLKSLQRYGMGRIGDLEKMADGEAYLVADVERLFAAPVPQEAEQASDAQADETVRAAPDGWQIVPVHPTPKMIDATFNHRHLAGESHNRRNYRIYAAMLAAAPSPAIGTAAQEAEQAAPAAVMDERYERCNGCKADCESCPFDEDRAPPAVTDAARDVLADAKGPNNA